MVDNCESSELVEDGFYFNQLSTSFSTRTWFLGVSYNHDRRNVGTNYAKYVVQSIIKID